MAIPSGLRALLSQMGLTQIVPGGRPPGAPGTIAGKASAMKGEKNPAAGEALGEEGLLLAGLGYAGGDQRTDRKNIAERSNLTRFLQEQLRDAPVPKRAVVSEEALLREAGDKAPAADGETAAEGGDKREANEARTEQQEVRPQDRRDDARVQGQKEATAEAKETSETAEAGEAEHQQQSSDEQDEEDKPGAGWVAEENEEDADEKRRGLRDVDALGQASRCRGTLIDGTRCLRRPEAGTPYCAEHAAQWRPIPARRRG